MNYLKTAGILAGVAFMASASVAFAQSTSPMSVSIGTNGHATLRGTVTAAASSSVSVKSWGGVWTVQIAATTKVTPHQGAANDVSSIKIGDTISVKGTAVADAGLTIRAKTVNDPAMEKVLEQEKKTNKNAIKDFGKTVKSIFEGVVSNLSGHSFTLTTGGGGVFTVQTSAATKFLNNRFLSLSGSSTISNNDHVRVFGTNASGTITAQIVRDVSVH
jgi:hypothetical protein